MFPCGQAVFAFTQGRTHWIVPIIALTVVSLMKESARNRLGAEKKNVFFFSLTPVFSSFIWLRSIT